MHPDIVTTRTPAFLFALLLACAPLPAQQEPQRESGEEIVYGSKFFDQLRMIFGRFQDSDLLSAFQEAQPIQCPELVAGKGEWRPVAFFNEDRRLGGWCRESLEEVKSNLDIYTFKGECRGNEGTIEVTTEFPTDESVDAYNQRRINLSQVDITVNDPVKVERDPKTMAYTFDLPYLFFKSQQGSTKTYSLTAVSSDSVYAKEVSNHWECKAVSSKDVTYRFLICRSATIPQDARARGKNREPSFGSAAFFILSDGIETHTSVKLIFGDGSSSSEQPTDPGAPQRPVLKRE